MNLGVVMDELAARLETIPGLRVYPHPVKSVVPPAAVIAYPDSITFDETYGRGMDRIDLVVWLVVADNVDRATREQIVPYVAGSGPRSIKAVLESGTYTAFDDVRVTDVEFDTLRVAGKDLVAVGFRLDIAGPGSMT